MSWDETPHRLLLCNFGGPESAEQVEPFLRRLFEDPFIIRSPWLGPRVRRFLAARIAKKRAPASTEEYRQIGFSPINRLTRLQAERLELRLRRHRPDTRVTVVNRYTGPGAEEAIRGLDPERERVFLLSLYPHLSHSTTVSSFRDVDLAFRARFGEDHPFPSIRIFSWWNDPDYLAYSFDRMRESLNELLETRPKRVRVVFSAHGLPRKYLLRGDPYVTETAAHVAELTQRGRTWLRGLGEAPQVSWHLSFQSRVGPVEWVKPYTDELLRELGKEGGAVLMVPISFTSDHIETLYEMDVTYKGIALDSGFDAFARVLAPNDDERFTDCLEKIVLRAGFL